MKAKTLARAALAALSLAAPAAIPVGRASATGSPVTLSLSSGSPYARPVVTASSCVDDATHERTLTAFLISGTGKNGVLAGRARGWPGHPAILIVPDWVDPAAPAFVEASCSTFDLTTETSSDVAYSPVPFDVLPPISVARQATTTSRTSLKAGQGLRVAGAGCMQPDTVAALTMAYEGADRTGRTFRNPGPMSFASVTGGTFTTEPVFAAGTVEFDLESTSENSTGFDPQSAQISNLLEEPVVFAPGPQTLITECYHQDGSALMFRPQVVNLLANPAVSHVELDAPGPGNGVRFRGLGCTGGPVHVMLEATSLQELLAMGPTTEVGRSASPVSPFAGSARTGPRPDARHRTVTAPIQRSASSPTQRVNGDLTTNGSVDTVVNPSSNGVWSYTDQTAFGDGVVTGLATCGDLYGAGFVYDFQGFHKSANDG